MSFRELVVMTTAATAENHGITLQDLQIEGKVDDEWLRRKIKEATADVYLKFAFMGPKWISETTGIPVWKIRTSL